MKIEMSINGGAFVELTLDDFLNAKLETGVPEIRFVRNDTHVGCHKYPSVEVTAIIDGIPRQHPSGFSIYHHLVNFDPDTSVYQLTRFELSIHHIDNPKYDIEVQMERQDLIGNEIYHDANLLEGMIHPILDIVNQIINCDLMIAEKCCWLNYSREFNIFKAILIGIAKNPNLAGQIANMLSILSSEQKEE